MYICISTTFGSIMTKRRSSGLNLNKMLAIMALIQTLLPLPVVPATNPCGICAMSPKIIFP